MRRLIQRFSATAISIFAAVVLAGGSVFACGMGSNYQNQTNINPSYNNNTNANASYANYSNSKYNSTYNSNYSYKSSHYKSKSSSGYNSNYNSNNSNTTYSGYNASSQAVLTSSACSTYTTGSNITASSQTNTSDLQYAFAMELCEHAALTASLMQAEYNQQSNAQDLQDALDANSQAIAGTVDQMYPGTYDQFLQLWRSHIDAYQQYLTGYEQNDRAGRQQAMQNLDSFTTDMTDFMGQANSQLDLNNLEQQLSNHGSQTLSIIDNLVAGNSTVVDQLTQQGCGQMSKIATAMMDP